MNHKKCCEAHSIKKAKNRYNITLNESDLKKIVKMIQNGDRQSLLDKGKSTKSRRFHVVSYKGKLLNVIYSKTMKTIVTILPP